MEAGQPVLKYNRDPISRADGAYKRGHYLHPLVAPDGTRMSDDMPRDHPHHRGIFWAWTQLWIGEKRIGHPWEQRDLEWEVTQVETRENDGSATLTARVLWKSPLWRDPAGQMKSIVSEVAAIRVHPAADDVRLIDFDIALQALEDKVRLGGSTDTKGYGGFSTRIPLPDDLAMNGPGGVLEPDWQKPSSPQPWVDFSGSFNPAGGKSGLAVLCHPTNPGSPHGWTLRKKDSCQNPVWPGNVPVLLPTDKPLTLRYRIILHGGATAEVDLEKMFLEYSGE